MLDDQLDILARELGAVADRVERETVLRIDAAIADLRRGEAERELRFATLERQVAERLASVKDGEPGPRGEGVTLDEVAPVIAQEVERAVAALPKAEKGERGEPGEPGPRGEGVTLDEVAPVIAQEVERAVAALPKAEKGDRGEPGPAGLFPVVKAWSDAIHYEGQIRTHHGATWQALRDTAKAPPHEDWICLANAGRDGRSPRVRETFDPKVEDYRELDIVAIEGRAFIARKDEPGPCPGAGWQVISTQGKTGKPGERGGPGPRGPAGPAIVHMAIDGEGLLSLQNADGSTVECDLYPLLSKIDR